MATFPFIAALLAAQSADAPIRVAEVNGWVIEDRRGHCSAYTMFGQNTFVRAAYDLPRDSATLFIANPAWESVQAGATYRVDVNFSNGSDYNQIEAQGVRVDNPEARVTGVALRFDGSDFVEDFAFAGSVTFQLGEVRLEALSLRGTRDAMLRLVRCAGDSARRYPIDPFREVAPVSPPAATQVVPRTVEPARARANLTSYVSNDDYPAAALRSREEGTVGYRINVGPDGRVADCTITASSGSATLDDATCRLIRARARFTPARNAGGEPTADTVNARYTWRLPEGAGRNAASEQPTRHWVQIGGSANVGTLRREFDRLRVLAPTLLGNRVAYTTPLRATNRLLVGPFGSEREALAFVNAIRRENIPAFAWSSEDGQAITPLP